MLTDVREAMKGGKGPSDQLCGTLVMEGPMAGQLNDSQH